MYFIIIALSILLLVALGYILFLKFFKKYTRERFAFVSVGAISVFITTVLLQIYSSEGYVSAFVNFSNAAFDTKFETYKTDFRDHLLTIILLIVFIYFVLHVFKNWNGPISHKTFEKNKYSVPSNILDEAAFQLISLLKNDRVTPYIEDQNGNLNSIFINHDISKLPWHINVHQLLTYSSDQFKIHETEDYYQKEKCYLGYYGKGKKHVIAILCTYSYPKINQIDDFINFVERTEAQVFEFIVAVKKGNEEMQTVFHKGREITIRYEDEMLESLIDFTSYFDSCKRRFYSEKVTMGESYSLSDIYVPIRGHEIQKGDVGKLEEYILNWVEETHENKHLAVLGEYGCGKSVLSLKITVDLINNLLSGNKGRVPILIELRGKSPRTLHTSEILSTWAQEYHINPVALMKLHKAGKLVIIFEGFDEMDMVGDKDMRLEHFQRLWEFASDSAKIVITGRPNFFLDDQELKTNLGIDKPYAGSPYCEALYLEKFDLDEIAEALRNIDKDTKNQVLEIIRNLGSSNFYDLVSRPAILYLVAIIWKERNLSELKERINSAMIIKEFILFSYSRQTGKKTKFPLSEKEREYFMIGIAVAMLYKSDYTNQISKLEFKNIVLELYRHIPDQISLITTGMEACRKPLRQRLLDNKAEETIMTDVRSCGIIVNDLTRRDYFKFAHKSFLEYQVSQYFVETLLQDHGDYNIIMNAISKALNISISSFKHSDETMSFTSEILISKLNLTVNGNERKIASKLYQILSPVKILGRLPSLAPFLDYISASRYNMLIGSAIPLPFVVYFSIINEPKEPIPLTIFMVLSIAFLFVLIILRIKLVNFTKLNRIWLEACTKLKIDKEIPQQLVGKLYCFFLESKVTSNFGDFLASIGIKIIFKRKNKDLSIDDILNNEDARIEEAIRKIKKYI
ncbi:MAG: NACHT domain-containing protein [Sphingobacterium sp.]